MFKFKRVKINNFLSIEEAELDLEKRGLVLVEGINKSNPTFQANGSGKSALLGAITYALYGQTPSGLKTDDVVNRQVGKDTSVKLFFDIDGQSYRIERYRKHSTHKNKVKLFQGNTELTGKSMRDTDEKIEELFGIDYSTYTNSIVQGQGESEVFSQATDKGKKEILENVTNIAIYQKAQDIAKEKVKEKNLEESEIRRDVEETKRNLEGLEDRQETERDNYKHTSNSINENKEELKKLKSSLEQSKQEYPKDIKRKINKLNKIEAPTYPEIDWSNDDFITTNESKKSQLETELYLEMSNIEQEGASKVAEIDNQVAQIENQVQPIMTTLGVLENEVENHKRDLGSLDLATECPVCGNPLDASHAEEESNRLEQSIAEKENKINNTRKLYEEELKPLIASLESQAEEIKKEYKEKVDKYRQSVTIEMKGIEQDLSYYKTEKEDKVRQDFEQKQVKYQSQVKEKEELIAERNKLDNEIDRLEQSIESTSKTIESLEKLPKPKDYSEDIKAMEEELEELNTELLAVTDKIDNYEDVVELYSNRGVRSVVLDLVTPFLNEKSNEYMATLSGSDIEILFSTQTQNKDGSLSDKFDVEINNSSGGGTYQSNSVGERKRIDLAISFAIQDLVLSKSNLETNMAIYDESFEGLDEVGSENVIKLLKERLEKLETIFVITHNSHLKALFENVITVEKENGLSKVV